MSTPLSSRVFFSTFLKAERNARFKSRAFSPVIVAVTSNPSAVGSHEPSVIKASRASLISGTLSVLMVATRVNFLADIRARGSQPDSLSAVEAAYSAPTPLR